MKKLKTYPSIQAYYQAEPTARHSVESDYGVWWKDPNGGNWRLTFVHETGDVYAIGLGGTISKMVVLGGQEVAVISAGREEGPVLILGRIAPFPLALEEETRRNHRFGVAPPDPAERALEGWAEKCGEQGSLEWALDRVSAAEAERQQGFELLLNEIARGSRERPR